MALCGEASSKSVPRLASAAIGFVEGSALAAPHGGDGFARDAAILEAPLDFEHGSSDRIGMLHSTLVAIILDICLFTDLFHHTQFQKSRWDSECWMGRLLSALALNRILLN